MQVEFPLKSLYFPATHAAHGPPSGPVNPMVQMQLVGVATLGGEPPGAWPHVFDGQARHVVLPAVEYV
jgi:hypothetical protein